MTASKQDADGWIEWHGGECPVDADSFVDVRFPDGSVESGATGRQWVWKHDKEEDGGDPPENIIAYRLCKPEQTEQQFCESVTRTIPSPKVPTIEYLAAEYRCKVSARRMAQLKLERATRAESIALGKLERAGESIGLLISPVKDGSAPDLSAALNITDWWDLQVNDLIKITSVHERGNEKYYSVIGLEALVVRVGDPHHQDLEVIPANSGATILIDGFEFIRRP